MDQQTKTLEARMDAIGYQVRSLSHEMARQRTNSILAGSVLLLVLGLVSPLASIRWVGSNRSADQAYGVLGLFGQLPEFASERTLYSFGHQVLTWSLVAILAGSAAGLILMLWARIVADDPVGTSVRVGLGVVVGVLLVGCGGLILARQALATAVDSFDVLQPGLVALVAGALNICCLLRVD